MKKVLIILPALLFSSILYAADSTLRVEGSISAIVDISTNPAYILNKIEIELKKNEPEYISSEGIDHTLQVITAVLLHEKTPQVVKQAVDLLELIETRYQGNFSKKFDAAFEALLQNNTNYTTNEQIKKAQELHTIINEYSTQLSETKTNAFVKKIRSFFETIRKTFKPSGGVEQAEHYARIAFDESNPTATKQSIVAGMIEEKQYQQIADFLNHLDKKYTNNLLEDALYDVSLFLNKHDLHELLPYMKHNQTLVEQLAERFNEQYQKKAIDQLASQFREIEKIKNTERKTQQAQEQAQQAEQQNTKKANEPQIDPKVTKHLATDQGRKDIVSAVEAMQQKPQNTDKQTQEQAEEETQQRAQADRAASEKTIYRNNSNEHNTSKKYHSQQKVNEGHVKKTPNFSQIRIQL